VLALSNLATSFASAILAKDTASEGGLLIDTKTRNALSTSQALKMYAVGEGGDENERRLRKLQAGEIENLPVDQALEMLLKCYKGTEIVTVQYDEGLGHKVTRVICAPDHCATSSFTFQDSAGKLCSNLTDSTCIPVAGELCTVSFQKSSEVFYTIKLPAEGSGGGFVASSGGGFVASSGGGFVASSGGSSFDGIPLPPVVN
jgi:hypothetical protein